MFWAPLCPSSGSAKLYTTVYDFQHLLCLQESCEDRRKIVLFEQESLHSAHDLPTNRPKTPGSTSNAENHMQLYMALRS